MEKIQSRSNIAIKDIVKLKQKKFRSLEGKSFVEGEKNVIEALNARIIDTIVFTEKYINSNIISFKDTSNNSIKQILVSDDIMSYISEETTSQQILAIIKIPEFNFIRPSSDFLILDNIQNPGNLGAILRSALAFNFKDIYLLNCVDTFSPKVLQSAAGNVFKLNLMAVNLENINSLLNNNIELCSTTFDGIDIDNFVLDKNKIYGLIMGNEGQGISKDLLEISKNKLTIKMANSVESLNVSVAASILMYKFFREVN